MLRSAKALAAALALTVLWSSHVWAWPPTGQEVAHRFISNDYITKKVFIDEDGKLKKEVIYDQKQDGFELIQTIIGDDIPRGLLKLDKFAIIGDKEEVGAEGVHFYSAGYYAGLVATSSFSILAAKEGNGWVPQFVIDKDPEPSYIAFVQKGTIINEFGTIVMGYKPAPEVSSVPKYNPAPQTQEPAPWWKK